MSETSESNGVKSDVISDKGQSIKLRQCNKFSIENILGLNDDVKVNRLEVIDLCRKGTKRSPFSFQTKLIFNDVS